MYHDQHESLTEFKNSTQTTKQVLMSLFSSFYTIDNLYIYILAPLNINGALLNSFCIYILSKPQFSTQKIYKYFRVYIMCSFLKNLGLFYALINLASPIYEFLNYYFIKVITNNALSLTCISLYSFSSSLVVCMGLLIINRFETSAKFIKNLPWKFTCALSLIICVVINIPFIIRTKTSFIDVHLAGSEPFSLYYTEISRQRIFVSLMSCFVRDLFTFVAHLCLIGYLITLINTSPANSAQNSYQQIFFYNNNRIEILNADSGETHLMLIHAETETRRNGMVRKYKQMACMVIVMSMLALIENVAMFFFFYDYMMNNEIVKLDARLTTLSIATASLKHSANFFILIFLNSKFQRLALNSGVSKCLTIW